MVLVRSSRIDRSFDHNPVENKDWGTTSLISIRDPGALHGVTEELCWKTGDVEKIVLMQDGAWKSSALTLNDRTAALIGSGDLVVEGRELRSWAHLLRYLPAIRQDLAQSKKLQNVFVMDEVKVYRKARGRIWK